LTYNSFFVKILPYQKYLAAKLAAKYYLKQKNKKGDITMKAFTTINFFDTNFMFDTVAEEFGDCSCASKMRGETDG